MSGQAFLTSQEFLWLNLGFGALIIVLFYLGRSRMKDPTKLRLRGGGKNQNAVVRRGSSGLSAGLSREARNAAGMDHVKNLNVIFVFNGHTWDAHEVLGVPAGARIEMVEAAYKQALRRNSPDSHSFIEIAYQAILETLKKS
jgi:hypothetical protein